MQSFYTFSSLSICYRALFLISAAFLKLFATADIEDVKTKLFFPSSLSFHQNEQSIDLELTGVTTREKLIVKVYSIAHYWQKPTVGSEGVVIKALFDDDTRTKEFMIQWVRNVSLKKVRESFYESFHEVLSRPQKNHLHPQIDHFLSLYDSDVEVNDKHLIRWEAGGKIQLVINDKLKGEINDLPFAKALWEIWLGDKCVVNRKELLSKIVTP